MNKKFLEIQPLIKKYGLKPKNSLGQNFLVDAGALQKVIAAAQISPEDHVLEIGAGLGSLTYLLAQSAARVTAVEIDQTLLPPLQEALSVFPHVTLVAGDILALEADALMPYENYIVVANIPYYITSAIIRHLLEARHKPARMVLTIQREVAERILARDHKQSLLSLSVQVFGKPEVAAVIPAGCFYPAPDVDSAILKVTLFPKPLIAIDKMDDFFALAKAGFSQKRKTLRNSLSAGLGIPPASAAALLLSAGIDPARRAETLTLAEWNDLTLRHTNTGNFSA